jgi:hypothetical protein
MNKKVNLHIQRVRNLAGVLPAVFLVFGAANFATAATPGTLPYFQDYQGITLGASPSENALSSNGASSSTWSVVDDGTGNYVYRSNYRRATEPLTKQQPEFLPDHGQSIPMVSRVSPHQIEPAFLEMGLSRLRVPPPA